jgi:peptidyl-prolyl cis-trans isomerase C
MEQHEHGLHSCDHDHPHESAPVERQIPPILVNGVAIDPEAVRREAQNHPAPTVAAAMRAAAQALVIRELLLQEAATLSILGTPEVDANGRRETDQDAAIRTLLEAEISVPSADTEACRRYYQNNLAKFRSEDIFEARHILIAASREDEKAYADAVQLAEDLIATLQSYPEQFADLALVYSACSSKQNGGNLGQVTRGQTVPEFETFLCGLDIGQLCPVPVRSRFGAHVLQLDRRVSGQQLPFEIVSPKIAAYLEVATWQRAVTQYLGILIGKAKIEGIVMAGSDSPLVQ